MVAEKVLRILSRDEHQSHSYKSLMGIAHFRADVFKLAIPCQQDTLGPAWLI